MAGAASTALKTVRRAIPPSRTTTISAADYGISGNSLKFIYYGWGIYELPFGKDKPYLNHGVAAAVLGGWQANTNLSAHSGVPLGFPDAGTRPGQYRQYRYL